MTSRSERILVRGNALAPASRMTEAALARVVMGSAGSDVSREGSAFTTAGSIVQSATCTTRSPHLTDKGAGERGMLKRHCSSACDRLQPKWLRSTRTPGRHAQDRSCKRRALVQNPLCVSWGSGPACLGTGSEADAATGTLS